MRRRRWWCSGQIVGPNRSREEEHLGSRPSAFEFLGVEKMSPQAFSAAQVVAMHMHWELMKLRKAKVSLYMQNIIRP